MDAALSCWLLKQRVFRRNREKQQQRTEPFSQDCPQNGRKSLKINMVRVLTTL